MINTVLIERSGNETQLQIDVHTSIADAVLSGIINVRTPKKHMDSAHGYTPRPLVPRILGSLIPRFAQQREHIALVGLHTRLVEGVLPLQQHAHRAGQLKEVDGVPQPVGIALGDAYL